MGEGVDEGFMPFAILEKKMRCKFIVRDARGEGHPVWGVWREDTGTGFGLGGPVRWREDMLGALAEGRAKKELVWQEKRVQSRVRFYVQGADDAFDEFLRYMVEERGRTIQPVRCFRRLIH